VALADVPKLWSCLVSITFPADLPANSPVFGEVTVWTGGLAPPPGDGLPDVGAAPWDESPASK